MIVGVIGNGAIARHLGAHIGSSDHTLGAILLRPERRRENPGEGHFYSVEDLPANLDLVIDCAGHTALAANAAQILRRGTDLVTVSLGALADRRLFDQLRDAARSGNSTLHLASGAIGALDCLQAARTGRLDKVTYV